MNTVKVRNITIGEGRPKICVPIVGKTREEILKEASTFSALPVDVAEWRVDWYDDVFDTEEVLTTAKRLNEALGEIPVLFTFRTSKEGRRKRNLSGTVCTVKQSRSGKRLCGSGGCGSIYWG